MSDDYNFDELEGYEDLLGDSTADVAVTTTVSNEVGGEGDEYFNEYDMDFDSPKPSNDGSGEVNAQTTTTATTTTTDGSIDATTTTTITTTTTTATGGADTTAKATDEYAYDDFGDDFDVDVSGDVNENDGTAKVGESPAKPDGKQTAESKTDAEAPENNSVDGEKPEEQPADGDAYEEYAFDDGGGDGAGNDTVDGNNPNDTVDAVNDVEDTAEARTGAGEPAVDAVNGGNEADEAVDRADSESDAPSQPKADASCDPQESGEPWSGDDEGSDSPPNFHDTARVQDDDSHHRRRSRRDKSHVIHGLGTVARPEEVAEVMSKLADTRYASSPYVATLPPHQVDKKKVKQIRKKRRAQMTRTRQRRRRDQRLLRHTPKFGGVYDRRVLKRTAKRAPWNKSTQVPRNTESAKVVLDMGTGRVEARGKEVKERFSGPARSKADAKLVLPAISLDVPVAAEDRIDTKEFRTRKRLMTYGVQSPYALTRARFYRVAGDRANRRALRLKLAGRLLATPLSKTQDAPRITHSARRSVGLWKPEGEGADGPGMGHLACFERKDEDAQSSKDSPQDTAGPETPNADAHTTPAHTPGRPVSRSAKRGKHSNNNSLQTEVRQLWKSLDMLELLPLSDKDIEEEQYSAREEAERSRKRRQQAAQSARRQHRPTPSKRTKSARKVYRTRLAALYSEKPPTFSEPRYTLIATSKFRGEFSGTGGLAVSAVPGKKKQTRRRKRKKSPEKTKRAVAPTIIVTDAAASAVETPAEHNDGSDGRAGDSDGGGAEGKVEETEDAEEHTNDIGGGDVGSAGGAGGDGDGVVGSDGSGDGGGDVGSGGSGDGDVGGDGDTTGIVDAVDDVGDGFSDWEVSGDDEEPMPDVAVDENVDGTREDVTAEANATEDTPPDTTYITTTTQVTHSDAVPEQSGSTDAADAPSHAGSDRDDLDDTMLDGLYDDEGISAEISADDDENAIKGTQITTTTDTTEASSQPLDGNTSTTPEASSQPQYGNTSTATEASSQLQDGNTSTTPEASSQPSTATAELDGDDLLDDLEDLYADADKPADAGEDATVNEGVDKADSVLGDDFADLYGDDGEDKGDDDDGMLERRNSMEFTGTVTTGGGGDDDFLDDLDAELDDLGF